MSFATLLGPVSHHGEKTKSSLHVLKFNGTGAYLCFKVGNVSQLD